MRAVPPRTDIVDPDLIEFGRVVRGTRVRLALSQRKFGYLIGIDQGSLSRLERGKLAGIRLRKVMRLLAEMGVIRGGRRLLDRDHNAQTAIAGGGGLPPIR